MSQLLTSYKQVGQNSDSYLHRWSCQWIVDLPTLPFHTKRTKIVENEYNTPFRPPGSNPFQREVAKLQRRDNLEDTVS